MEDVSYSLKLFEEGNSCAQAVLGAYCKRVGLDQSQALKIGSGLGGGVGRSQHICGAINAGAIILGLKYNSGVSGDAESKDKANELVGRFVYECENMLGSVECKDLLKIDLRNPEERSAAKESGLFHKVCDNAVEQTAIILEKYLSMNY
jgi:C_GCAxxG_C_C family probable redox protein